MLKSQKKNRNQDQRSLNRHESPYVLLEANTLSTDLQYAYNKWRIIPGIYAYFSRRSRSFFLAASWNVMQFGIILVLFVTFDCDLSMMFDIYLWYFLMYDKSTCEIVQYTNIHSLKIPVYELPRKTSHCFYESQGKLFIVNIKNS